MCIRDRTDAMSLHKLAVCCEALGRWDEALTALARAEAMLPEDEAHAPCLLYTSELKLAMVVERHLVNAQRAFDLGVNGELVVCLLYTSRPPAPFTSRTLPSTAKRSIWISTAARWAWSFSLSLIHI